MNGMNYDPSKIGAEIDLSGGIVEGKRVVSTLRNSCFQNICTLLGCIVLAWRVPRKTTHMM